MSQKHGLARMPAEVESASREDLTRANGKCPLCCEYEIVSSRRYRSHVGHHLEQLALFVLAGAEEVEEYIDDEEESGMSQSESDETEDEDQTTDAYEREQDSVLSGIAKLNAIDEADAKNEEAAKRMTELPLGPNVRIRLQEAAEYRKARDEEGPGGIKFKDVLGREFDFPWFLCAKWSVRYPCLLLLFECQQFVNHNFSRIWNSPLNKSSRLWRLLAHMFKQVIMT